MTYAKTEYCSKTEKITQVVEKFRQAKIDALFTPLAILVKSSVPQE